MDPRRPLPQRRLKRNELKQFGEYRTQRYVLHIYDQMTRGELPDLEGV